MIILSDQVTATTTDILQGTRLQTIGPGLLVVELQASDADATNNFKASLQLPNGMTPLNEVLVPCGNTSGLAGVLDDRTALRMEFMIGVDDTGHAVLSCTETGAATLTWRVSAQSAG